jgi:hypothetical protein
LDWDAVGVLKVKYAPFGVVCIVSVVTWGVKDARFDATPRLDREAVIEIFDPIPFTFVPVGKL